MKLEIRGQSIEVSDAFQAPIERSTSQAHYDDDDDDRHFGGRPHQSREHYPPEGRKRDGFFSRLFDFD